MENGRPKQSPPDGGGRSRVEYECRIALTVLRATVGTPIVARQPQNIAYDCLLQLDKTLIDFGTVTAVVVKGFHQGSFFAVDKYRHPG